MVQEKLSGVVQSGGKCVNSVRVSPIENAVPKKTPLKRPPWTDRIICRDLQLQFHELSDGLREWRGVGGANGTDPESIYEPKPMTNWNQKRSDCICISTALSLNTMPL